MIRAPRLSAAAIAIGRSVYEMGKMGPITGIFSTKGVLYEVGDLPEPLFRRIRGENE